MVGVPQQHRGADPSGGTQGVDVIAGAGEANDPELHREASSTGWDRNPPAPAIPDEVVGRTREKYIEAYERITGEPFDAWLKRTR